MKTKLKTLAKVAKQRSAKMRYPIVFRGDTATATNDTTELTLRVPIDWSGDEPTDGVKLDADAVLKIAACLSDYTDRLSIEVSEEYATVNGVRVRHYGDRVPSYDQTTEERVELEVTDELRTAVEEVRACVDKDYLYPILQGVYIDATMVAATDAHVLAWRDVATGLPDGVKAVIYPDMLDMLPDGCRTIKVGAKYNVSESDAGRVISKRPADGCTYPNVRAVIPANHDGAVTLDGAAVRDALKTAKKRKLEYMALVVKDGAAGFEFLEYYDDDNGDNMRVSLPCEVETGSKNAVLYLHPVLLGKLLAGSNAKRITVKYTSRDNVPVTIESVGIIMPRMNDMNIGHDFTPDRIELPELTTVTRKATEATPEKKRIVELPDGTYVVIGGRKPKGGRTIKAWIIDNIDEL